MLEEKKAIVVPNACRNVEGVQYIPQALDRLGCLLVLSVLLRRLGGSAEILPEELSGLQKTLDGGGVGLTRWLPAEKNKHGELVFLEQGNEVGGISLSMKHKHFVELKIHAAPAQLHRPGPELVQ